MTKIINVTDESLFIVDPTGESGNWYVEVKPYDPRRPIAVRSDITKSLARDGKSEVNKTTWLPTTQGTLDLSTIELSHPDSVIVGDRSQAVAYPGRILAPVVYSTNVHTKDSQGNEYDDDTVYRYDEFKSY